MAERAPLDGVDVVLADLDGVVYRGPTAIPHAVESLTAAQERGRRLAFITNNASRTAASVAEHLTRLGLRVAPEDVVTSPHAAVRMLSGLVPAGSAVLVVGGDGLVDPLVRAGFRVTRSAEDGPAAVVQGFAPDVGWAQLAEAAFALQAAPDIPWIATNMDWTLPLERGTAPGNGTLVSAVHTAVGRLPLVAGKPEVPIFEEAAARTHAVSPLFIGDRLDTDIQGARRAGMRSALVLTGIDGPRQVLAASDDARPDFLLADLRELAEPYPEADVRERRGRVTVTVRDARVTREGTRLVIERAGSHRVDLVRAGAAAIWRSGQSIHALQVPAELYS